VRRSCTPATLPCQRGVDAHASRPSPYQSMPPWVFWLPRYDRCCLISRLTYLSPAGQWCCQRRLPEGAPRRLVRGLPDVVLHLPSHARHRPPRFGSCLGCVDRLFQPQPRPALTWGSFPPRASRRDLRSPAHARHSHLPVRPVKPSGLSGTGLGLTDDLPAGIAQHRPTLPPSGPGAQRRQHHLDPFLPRNDGLHRGASLSRYFPRARSD
jgi:hypothetical protein